MNFIGNKSKEGFCTMLNELGGYAAIGTGQYRR